VPVLFKDRAPQIDGLEAGVFCELFM